MSSVVGGVLVCGAVWFVLLHAVFKTAQPVLLLSPGVVALAPLALGEHPVIGCVVCDCRVIEYAVCGASVGLVCSLLAAGRKVVHRARGRKNPHCFCESSSETIKNGRGRLRQQRAKPPRTLV